MFLVMTMGWIIGGQQLPELGFGGYVLGVITFILGISIIWALWGYKDINLSILLHVITGLLTMIISFYFVLPSGADRFTLKKLSNLFLNKCNKNKEINVDKFFRPCFMFYTVIPRNADL